MHTLWRILMAFSTIHHLLPKVPQEKLLWMFGFHGEIWFNDGFDFYDRPNVSVDAIPHQDLFYDVALPDDPRIITQMNGRSPAEPE